MTITLPAPARESEHPTTDGLPAERRPWAIAAIFTALAMASLDTAIANIALPTVASDLRVSPEQVIWVVNVYQIAVVATLLPQMMAQDWGRIINITGKSEPEGLNAAFAAKAAVHAWAKGLSREIGEHGITINCIPPGRIMSEQIRRNYPPDYRERFAEEEIPVGYWGEPEDLAALAVFLASPVARYITGTVIPVDGGLRRYQF